MKKKSNNEQWNKEEKVINVRLIGIEEDKKNKDKDIRMGRKNYGKY